MSERFLAIELMGTLKRLNASISLAIAEVQRHIDGLPPERVTLAQFIHDIAQRNGGEFRPTQDKRELIAAGYLPDSKYGANKLHRTLEEMGADHIRRNLWRITDD